MTFPISHWLLFCISVLHYVLKYAWVQYATRLLSTMCLILCQLHSVFWNIPLLSAALGDSPANVRAYLMVCQRLKQPVSHSVASSVMGNAQGLINYRYILVYSFISRLINKCKRRRYARITECQTQTDASIKLSPQIYTLLTRCNQWERSETPTRA